MFPGNLVTQNREETVVTFILFYQSNKVYHHFVLRSLSFVSEKVLIPKKRKETQTTEG